MQVPIRAILKDHWTAERLSQNGVLYASPHIKEVALLRALDLPATLALGMRRLSLPHLRELDTDFGGQDLAPGASQNAGALKPALALLAWSPLAVTAQPSPVLLAALPHLAAARRHLGLAFPGVMAWQPQPQDVANLQFRLPFADRQLIREFLQEIADALTDFELLQPISGSAALADGTGDAPLPAQANLLAALADDRTAGPSSQRLERAWAIYQSMVQRDLIAPLEQWARASADPVHRNAGVALASVCGLLHQMSPLLLNLQGRRSLRALEGDAELLPAKSLAQYLSLISRLGGLIRDLCRWRNT